MPPQPHHPQQQQQQQQQQPAQQQQQDAAAPQQQQQAATSSSGHSHGSGFFIVSAASDIRQHVLKNIGNSIAALHYSSLAGLAQQGITLDPNTGSPTTPISPSQVTPFFSASSPGMALSAYAQRLVDMSTYGYDGLAYALVLLGRYVKITGRLPSMLTVHRQVLTCLLSAMKCNSDLFYKNKFLSRVGGVPLTEVNRMEAHLMQVLNFSAGVTEVEIRGVLTDMAACGAARSTDITACFHAMTHSVAVSALLPGQIPVNWAANAAAPPSQHGPPTQPARTGLALGSATVPCPASQPNAIEDSDDEEGTVKGTAQRNGHNVHRQQHHVPISQAQ